MTSSRDVIATKEQVNRALKTILMQLEASGIAENFDSLSDAVTSLGLWEFVENQAKVKAQLFAFSVRDNNVISKLTEELALAKKETEELRDELSQWAI